MRKLTIQQNDRVSILLAFSLIVSCSALSIPSASAADDAGSMDSVWMDQADKSGGEPHLRPAVPVAPGAARQASPAADQPSTPAVNLRPAVQTAAPTAAVQQPTTQEQAPAPLNFKTVDDSSTASSTDQTNSPSVSPDNAPMCKLDAFKTSALVTKGGWPGVGPFKSDSATEYSDGNANSVKLEVSGNQITRAEMNLPAKQSIGNTQLLDMQMNLDFLLEAVGLNSKRIEKFNGELEKNRGELLKADSTPLNIKTGRVMISIERRPAGSGDGIDYHMIVNSLDANPVVIHEQSQQPVANVAPQSTGKSLPIFIKDKPPAMVLKKDSPKHPEFNALTPMDKRPLKEQFTALINDWQQVKKEAVRNRETQELANVLSGKALTRQSDAIKWLQTNKKYYDMTPRGALVEQFTELATGKRYMVAAQVHESYKFIDEATGKVLKDVDDVNKVNYTVEKVNGHWVITDSALLSTAVKTPGSTKTTR